MPRKKSKPEPEPESPRDTHFAGFAGLITDEIMQLDGMGFDENDPDIDAKIAKLIAQRAYDLVQHTLNEATLIYAVYQVSEQYKPEDIPDLTQWTDSPTQTNM